MTAFGGRIVIVGASLAGLCAAETLCAEGFSGPLTLIGDEPYLPYDRPPLSKAVLSGWIAPEHTQLPRRATRSSDVEWWLGVPATSLDLSEKQVILADGRAIDYDRLLIATGTRARPWFNEVEANLDGVFTLRGRDDARQLRARLVGNGTELVAASGWSCGAFASYGLEGRTNETL